MYVKIILLAPPHTRPLVVKQFAHLSWDFEVEEDHVKVLIAMTKCPTKSQKEFTWYTSTACSLSICFFKVVKAAKVAASVPPFLWEKLMEEYLRSQALTYLPRPGARSDTQDARLARCSQH